MGNKIQQSLFGEGELLSREQEEWQDMPEFVQEEQQSYAKIIIRFRNKEDLQEFSKLIKQDLNENTKSIWHPKLKFEDHFSYRYVEEDES